MSFVIQQFVGEFLNPALYPLRHTSIICVTINPVSYPVSRHTIISRKSSEKQSLPFTLNLLKLYFYLLCNIYQSQIKQ